MGRFRIKLSERKEYETKSKTKRDGGHEFSPLSRPAMRREVLRLGISQISGGSNTSVGGYDDSDHGEEDTAQFDVSDRRTLDQVVAWLLDLGYVPSFCKIGRASCRERV